MLTLLMYGTWLVSRWLLPEGLLRRCFSRLFETRVGDLSFTKILLANLFPVLGIQFQFMNLYRGRRWRGRLYILPIFWMLYAVLLGTDSFVFAGQPVSFSFSTLWTRMGFSEPLAYTAGMKPRTIGLPGKGLEPRRLVENKWNPRMQDWIYWAAGLLLLVIGAWQEVH